MKKILFLIALVFIISCKKEKQFVGNKLITFADSVRYTTINAISVKTIEADSAISVNYSYHLLSAFSNSRINILPNIPAYTKNILGSYTDPVFGLVNASLLFQVTPELFTDIRASVVKVDSVLLFVKFDSVYGKNMVNQTIKVNRLTKSIEDQNTSNIDITTFIDAAELTDGGTAGSYKLNDGTIRIRLNNSLAVNNLLVAGGTPYNNNANDFQTFFNGLCLQSVDVLNDEGGIGYCNLFNASTKLVVYYNDSSTFNYIINENCSRINVFKHNYQNASFAQSLNKANNDSLAYVQGMAGTRVQIVFNELDELKKMDIISKAELFIPVQTNSLFPVCEQMVLTTTNSSLQGRLVLDDPYYTNVEMFGGKFVEGAYLFNVTRHIQALKDGVQENVLYLASGLYTSDKTLIFNSLSPKRSVINTATHSNGMKLKITYLTLE
jgi:hypothetical protein